MAKTKEMQKGPRRKPRRDSVEKTRERLFDSRWQTLMRKAKSLAALCKGQVCMVMSTPNGNVRVWPKSVKLAEAEAGSIMTKFLEATFKRRDTRKTQELNLSDFSDIHNKEVVANAGDDHKGSVTKWHEKLDHFSLESLMDLSVHLRSKVGQIEETLGSIVYVDQANNYFQHNSCHPQDFWPSSADYCYNINPSEEQQVVPETQYFLMGCEAVDKHQPVAPETQYFSMGFEAVDKHQPLAPETRYFSMGFEAVDEHQPSAQNISDFGETQFMSQSDQHEQYMDAPPQSSYPYCFDVLNPESDSMPPLASCALMY